jgi:hypothetical protein
MSETTTASIVSHDDVVERIAEKASTPVSHSTPIPNVAQRRAVKGQYPTWWCWQGEPTGGGGHVELSIACTTSPPPPDAGIL